MSQTSREQLKVPALGTADAVAAMEFGGQFRTNKRIVFVVNNDRFFLTHRASWASSLLASGARVTVVAEDTGHGADIEALGCEYIPLHFGRESVRPHEALLTAIRLFVILLKSKPDFVFLIATAVYSLGWPAALLLRKAKFVQVLTGAGRALSSDARSNASRFVRLALSMSTKLPNMHSLFQLRSDFDRFVAEGLAVPQRSTILPGTGIDTDAWTPAEKPETKLPVVLFAARLFREKGIYEFIELARSTSSSRAKFVVVGEPDTGVSSSVSEVELQAWQREGLIDYIGQSNDMLSVFRTSDILVLPSTHPEGTPRVLIEAAACGVVAIASDQPGCREVVVHGQTGLIASVFEPGSFAAALNQLLVDGELRQRYSQNARSLACERFSLDSTLGQLYRSIGIES